nr:YqaA family protein [uncultured Fluviicola sp.]
MAFEWGLFGLFLVCFLASTIIPFPSEATLLFFLNSESYSPLSILVVASLGNCLGGCTNYLLGYYGRKILGKKQFLKSELFVQRYGSWTALFSWLPIIGDPILIVLGVYRVSFWKTMTLMSLGKVVRYLIVFWTYFYFAFI